MRYYFKVLTNYAVFTGRASRSEYWYFALFNLIIYFVMAMVGRELGVPALRWIYYAGIAIPYIAVGVRRMHDVGKSGWNILIPIYSLILACTDSDIGENEYGPNPKYETEYGADDYQKPFDINP